MIQGLIFGISIAIAVAAFFIFRGERKKYFHTTLKVIAILYFTWVFFRYMLADSFIWVIKGGYYGDIYYESTDYLHSILRWGHYVSYIAIPMAVFFKSRLFKNICIYFCLPFAILSTIYFGDFIFYFMAPNDRGIHTAEWFRQFYLSIEFIIAIVVPLLFVVVDRHYFNVKDKTEWKNFLLSLPFMILLLIPVYLPQSLFGYTSITLESMTIGNLIWFIVTAIELVSLYLIFRFKNARERYMVCMFLALALFMHYNSLFLMGLTIDRLPIQLCNLAAYMFVPVLLLKKQSFFNFVFLANVMGTLIAMLAPDINGGAADFWNVHFLIEHMQVLVIPCLCMLLRLFPRLEPKALKHLAIGFSIYFLFCWATGTILNGYADVGGYEKVNFFYIFDLAKAFDYFPFLSVTENVHWVLFDKFHIYPIFQLIIYFGFLSLCLLLYFTVIKLYDILDDHYELRKARINMYEKISKKPFKGQKEYID